MTTALDMLHHDAAPVRRPQLRIHRNAVYVHHADEVLHLAGHRLAVTCAQLSPDRRLIVTGSQDTTVRVWDARTGQEIHVLRGHRLAVNVAAVSPAGHLLASGSTDRTIRIWDLSRGQEIACLEVGMPVHGLVFSPESQYLISGGACDALRMWNLRHRRQVAEVPSSDLPDRVSPCGEFLELRGGRRLPFPLVSSAA